MTVELADKVETSPNDRAVAEGQRSMARAAMAPGDEQILQALGELKLEVSALRSEVLGQNQQMLSRIQFLHEGLIGRIKQMREQAATPMRRRGR